MADSGANDQNLGNLVIHVDADISGANASFKQGQKSVRDFSKAATDATKTISASTGVLNNILKNSFRYLVLHAVIVKGVLMTVRGTITSVKNAMNMVESENLFNVSMGNMATAARNWSDQLQQSLGLNAYEIRKNIGMFYNMTTSMGLASEKAYDVSKGLTQLSYDMASFYNLPYQEAFVKLQAGIVGEIEPLRRLGIVVTDNVIKNYAYATGLAKTGTVLTEQQKILARYGVILNSTKTAQGDLARTLSSPANQARMLNTNIQLLSINIGRIFLPIIQAAIPIINNMVSALSTLAAAAANFMEAFFGVDYSVQAGGINEAANAQENLANATDKASKAAKKSVMSFDEVYTIQEDAADAVKPAVTPTPSTPSGDDTVKEGILPGLIKKLDLDPIITSFNNLKAAIEPLTKTISSGLKWAWDNVLVPIGKWTISQAIPAFFNLLSGALTALNPLLTALQPLFMWLWDNFLLPIATWTGGIIIDVLNGLAVSLKSVSDWMTTHQSTVTAMTACLVGFFAVWKGVEIMSFIAQSGSIIAAIAKITAATSALIFVKWLEIDTYIRGNLMYAGDFLVAMGKGVAAIVASTAKWIANTAAMVAHKVVLISSSIAQGVMTAAMTLWNIACGIGTVVTTAFGIAMQILLSPITLIILAVIALIAGIVLLVKNWDTVKAVAKSVWDWIVKTWGVAAAWFKTNVTDPIGKFFSNGFNTIKDVFLTVFEFIQRSIKGFVNGWLDLINGFISTAIGAVNSVISTVNSVKFTVPDWIPGVGGKSIGADIPPIKTPTIPKLAKGGITNSPTLAMISENNQKEAVVPLNETSLQPFAKVIGDQLSKVFPQQNNDSRPTVYVHTLIGDEAGFRQLERQLNLVRIKENQRKGLSENYVTGY